MVQIIRLIGKAFLTQFHFDISARTGSYSHLCLEKSCVPCSQMIKDEARVILRETESVYELIQSIVVEISQLLEVLREFVHNTAAILLLSGRSETLFASFLV